MSEKHLRGSRLGGVSYETDRGHDYAPRTATQYACPKGHRFGVPFANEAETIPDTWACRRCGGVATRVDGAKHEPVPVKPARTHMDMLRERRTTADLEAVLKERLAVHHARTKPRRTA